MFVFSKPFWGKSFIMNEFWPLISYSYSPTDQTLHHFFNLVTDIDLHGFKRAWHASRKHLPLRTPGSVTFWNLHMLGLLRQVFRIYTSFMTSYRSWLYRITRGFHWAFVTGVTCQQGALTLPDTRFRFPFLGLAYNAIVETSFPELAVSFLDFLPRIPLGTNSILLRVSPRGIVWSRI